MYWHKKIQSEALDMDEDDHNDLVTILLSQTSENIPEDMKCMWEQQITLIQQNKHGYR